jgi:hypothetical protein
MSESNHIDRWEPPRGTTTESTRRRPRLPQLPRRDLPEIWLMVVLRLGITLVLVITVLFDALRNQMHYVAPIILAGLLAVVLQTNTNEMQKLRKQTLLDLAILLAIVPAAVLNGFVAAEPGALLPAERSALLQTGGGLLIAVAIIVWLGVVLFPDDRDLLPAVLLPGLTVVIAVTFVLHDYRNQTVIAMIAISYFVGAASIAIGAMVDETVRRYVPLAFFASTILAGLALFDPGLQDVFERDGLVQLFTGFMILIGFTVLIAIPNPNFETLLFSGRSNRGRPVRSPRSHRQRRDMNDTGRHAEE